MLVALFSLLGMLLPGVASAAPDTVPADVVASTTEERRAVALARTDRDVRQMVAELDGFGVAWNEAGADVHDGKAWVSALATPSDDALLESVVLRVAVDLRTRSAEYAQRLHFSGSGVADQPVQLDVVDIDGATVWAGSIDPRGDLAAAAPYGSATDVQAAKKLCVTDTASATTAMSATGDAIVGPSSVQALGVCEWAVGALCGTGGGVACYFVCIGLGLVSGPGGVGCAAACALVGSLGCIGATNAICG